MDYQSLTVGAVIGIILGALSMLLFQQATATGDLIAQGQCSVYIMNVGTPESSALEACSDPAFREMLLNQPHEVDLPDYQTDI